jgi:membrane-associated protein
MELIDFILHIDEHLQSLINSVGPMIYAVLFGIIFAETGFVVTPFLPGDSLLFAAGALAGGGLLDVRIIIPMLLAAAIIGDSVNYYIGQRLGKRAFSKDNARFFKPEYLAKTQAFYEKHGGKTIIIARFLPIVRTFAPFVAGVGHMDYRKFLTYNVIGAVLWVVGLTLAGYFFGSIPVVKENFEIAIFIIIGLSILPVIIEFIKHRLAGKNRAAPKAPAEKVDYADIKETFKKQHID